MPPMVAQSAGTSAPFPVLVYRRGRVSSSMLTELHHDRRLRPLPVCDLSAPAIGPRYRASAVVVATSDDPLESLVYTATAELEIPVVLLVMKRFLRQRADLIGAGALDCLPLPVDRRHIDVLVSQLTHRPSDLAAVSSLSLLLDPLSRTVIWGDKRQRLSPREFALLYLLNARPGEPVSADSLMRGVWCDRPSEPSRQALDVFVYQLRQKLERIGLRNVVLTVRNFGYMLAPPRDDRAALRGPDPDNGDPLS